jgi:hypothetical protein
MLRCHPPAAWRVQCYRRKAEDLTMKTVAKLLIVLGFGAALTGCVVAPAPYYHARGYVVAPAPVVVVHPCCARW